ncbi:MAG TPA: hypothetical protein P5087_05995 [Eubacteriales bacterium]|nr:hypothetical protein [Eubacteriales bacterium]
MSNFNYNNVTKDAFRGYVFGTICLWGFFKHDKLNNENFKEGFQWAINVIDKSFDIIIHNQAANYNQKGCFSIYENQMLTPVNAILMDMFELLLFGENCATTNMAKDIPAELIEDMKIKLWSIMSIFQRNANNEILAEKYHEMKKQLEIEP